MPAAVDLAAAAVAVPVVASVGKEGVSGYILHEFIYSMHSYLTCIHLYGTCTNKFV
jgi:hypothetical protein